MQAIRQIFIYTSRLRPYIIAIAIMSVLGALVGFINPFLIKFATDWAVRVISGAEAFSYEPLIGFGIVSLVGVVIGIIIADVGGYLGDQLAIRTRRQLASAYYQHLLLLPQTYYDNESTGKIINRLSRAITDITNFLQFFSNNLLQMLITLVLSIGILLWYSWPLAVMFVLLVPFNLYLTAKTSKKWQAIEKEKNQHFDTASGRFNEVVSQMRLVKSFGTARREHRLFDKNFGSMVDLNRTQSRHWHSMNAIRGAAFGTVNTVVVIVLFYLTGRGEITIGDSAMLLVLIQQINFPMRNISFFVDSYQRAVANSEDYLAVMKEEQESGDTKRQQLKLSGGRVEYDDVTFSYGKKQVLDSISFDLPADTKLALVGESGGGKTTLTNLLMRLYEPDSGAIRIDGQDIRSVSRASVRDAIATVFQEPALFSGTIRENIAYARPGASDEEVTKAAVAANADAFITKLENGYDTEIGERGVKLSGGQKQRIAIARAILKDAPILILDEATSSLDSKSEALVQEALDRLMHGRTTIIIAHRLSTIANVDMIVTLRAGMVDEVGPPAKLAKTGGIYSELLALQLKATDTTKKQLEKFDIAA